MDSRDFITVTVRGALAVLALVFAGYVVTEFLAQSQVMPTRNRTAQELVHALDSPYSAPQFAGISVWLNSPPLRMKELRGKVVLLDFWTYGCIDCVRALPYTAEWYRKYRNEGLVVIGVHSPEFEVERNIDNVKTAIARYGIRYPVAVDNHLDTWRAFSSHAWPAHYLIDRDGRVVYIHFGEGGYDITENNIRRLLHQDGGATRTTAAPSYPPPHSRNPPHGRTFRDCELCPDMVVIPVGSFEMGQQPVTHHVEIRNAFALSKYEITQAEWQAIMGSNPSHFKGKYLPVEMVNWNDVQEYIQKLNQKTGGHYRLPSEAEWEYACRAGGPYEYCGGDDASSVAWYGAYGGTAGNSGQMTHPVGVKQRNAFGLYDMSGNVWEWVADPWHDGYDGAPADGGVWAGNGAKRVIRGGSWLDYPLLARAGFRVWAGVAKRSSDLGFRLAMTLPRRVRK